MLHQYLAQSGGKEKILGGLDEFWNVFPPGIADTLQRDFFLMAAMYFYICVCECVCAHTYIQCVHSWFVGFFALSKVRIKGRTGVFFATTPAKFQGA